MFKLIRPLTKEISTNVSPDVVMRNIGLHVSKPSGFLKSKCDTLFVGEVDHQKGAFSLQKNHTGSHRKRAAFVRAEGEVSRFGEGSRIRYTLRTTRFRMAGLLIMMVVFLFAAIGLSIEQIQINPDHAYYTVPLMGVGGIVAGALFTWLMKVTAQREFAALDSYLEKQSMMKTHG